jgi:DNA (cytosine-5)-methyltransferase 1
VKALTAADLFCGAGGTSEGLARACARSGRKLDLIAVNHWDLAIETHRKNHPEARHVCAALEGLNPRDLVPSGRLNLLVASPECTNHSVARGGRPVNDQSRASAWLILKWLQELYVDSILIENVAEFQQWGPLGANGKPLKSKKGELFRQFLATLRSLGYAVEWKVLNAANYGDPTTRERLFIIGRRGKNRTIPWPAQTHAQLHKIDTLFGALKPWRSAREIIDWSIPGKSIFHRKKPLADKTLLRILAGMQKFRWPEPFIVVLRNHMAARSVGEPLPTVAAGGSHLGLCEPQPFILQQQSCGAPRSVEDPIPAIATAGAISFIVPYRGEREGQAPRTHDIAEPMPAITTEAGHGVVQPFIITSSHGDSGGDRCRKLDQPLPSVTATRDHAVVEPMIVRTDCQGGKGGRCRSLQEPIPTITTKNGLAIVSPFMAEMRNGKTANSIDEPLSTVATSGAHHALVEPAFLTKYYGQGVTAAVADPLDTVTGKARFGLCQIGDTIYDVHFRMLKPRELARAQGFPDRYQFPKQNDKATKLIGNAVPTNLAEALCWELIV